MSDLPPTPPPEANDRPRPEAVPLGPVGLVSMVLGLCSALVAWVTPAVAFASLGALGGSAVILGLVAGSREDRASWIGIIGGLVAVVVAGSLYSKYAGAMDVLHQFG